MIITGGENIASSEVERVIYELPQVREAAVIGVPDAQLGRAPVRGRRAEGRAGARLSRPWPAHCAAQLAGFKVPEALVVRDALPRNPSGKVLKRVLLAGAGGLAGAHVFPATSRSGQSSRFSSALSAGPRSSRASA